MIIKKPEPPKGKYRIEGSEIKGIIFWAIPLMILVFTIGFLLGTI